AASITKLFLTKHGYSDKVETKTTGDYVLKVTKEDLDL
ncbi:unnamed protein product, partial [marine sediment metagenome]